MPSGEGGVHAATIVTRSHLGQARVMASSFRQHHPAGSLTVVVLDPADHPPAIEGVRVVGPDGLGLDEAELDIQRAIYDPLELSCAGKPLVLRRLLDEGAPAAMWLDADVHIAGPLDDLVPLAVHHGALFTPHLSRPTPLDDQTPDETHTLISGVCNLGFCIVGPQGRDLLNWWAARLARHCLIDHAAGLLADQRWIDLALGMFEHHLLDDPGVNAGYWNLGGRRLARGPAGVTVDDAPLRLLHLSGYDPQAPWSLSRHLGPRPRVRLREQPVLAELLTAYRQRLAAVHQDNTGESAPWPWGRSADGTLLTTAIRRHWRAALLRSEADGGEAPPSPWSAPTAFGRWVMQVPAGETHWTMAESAGRRRRSRVEVALAGFTSSRHRPAGERTSALVAVLAAAGLDYVHLEETGARRCALLVLAPGIPGAPTDAAMAISWWDGLHTRPTSPMTGRIWVPGALMGMACAAFGRTNVRAFPWPYGLPRPGAAVSSPSTETTEATVVAPIDLTAGYGRSGLANVIAVCSSQYMKTVGARLAVVLPAAATIADRDRCEYLLAGRTDAGVHDASELPGLLAGTPAVLSLHTGPIVGDAIAAAIAAGCVVISGGGELRLPHISDRTALLVNTAHGAAASGVGPDLEETASALEAVLAGAASVPDGAGAHLGRAHSLDRAVHWLLDALEEAAHG